MRRTLSAALAAAMALCAAPAVTAGDGASRLRDMEKHAKRGRFNSRTTLPCAQERGEPPGTCEAGVARGADGTAVVAVRFPNGFARHLRFAGGRFLSADTTMSGTGRDTDWALREGVHVIRVDDQRYEIPDAFVFGPDAAPD